MKKLILIVIGIIVIIIGIIGVCKGFKIREDVVVSNYIFSADGKKVSFDATVTSTVGYVRKVKVKDTGDSKYISFYSTFGILNSKIGAQSKFEIDLEDTCTKLYVYQSDGEYKLMFEKKDNDWYKAK